MRSVLFVCTANICRSPMAEVVLRRALAQQGVDERAVEVASAGTHDYQVGRPPFEMAVEAAKKRGYEVTPRAARAVSPNDFDHFDHILVMDNANLAHMRTIAPTRSKQKIELLLEYGDEFHGKEITDPYGGRPADYERALDMIEDGCRGLVQILIRTS